MSWQNRLIKNFMRIGVKPKMKSTPIDSGRETLAQYVDRYMPRPPREIEITPIDSDGFKGELVRKKKSKSGRTILYLHGGGFMSASVESHRGITCGLAMDDAGSVWALDYPLAPEHTIEEIEQSCIKAYEHLLESGIDPGAMAIAGDQAGAWLATKMIIHFRNLGKPLPAALVLLCPFLDTTLSGASFVANRDADPFADASMAESMLDTIFPDRDRSSPEWCLLNADLSDFPPVLLQSSNIDLAADDATRMAQALEAQGCEARLEIWDDVPPVWHLFWWAMPEAKSAVKSVAKFVTDRLKTVKGRALSATN